MNEKNVDAYQENHSIINIVECCSTRCALRGRGGAVEGSYKRFHFERMNRKEEPREKISTVQGEGSDTYLNLRENGAIKQWG